MAIVTGMILTSSTNIDQLAFAESNTESAILVSDKLKNNPMAMKIIAEMEAQKLRYKQLSEETTPKSIPTKAQIEIEKNRKISNQMLQDDLKSMEKKYIDFSPENAYEKFVLKLNSVYHGIFRDQFNYLNAKVHLAIAAKNLVLENGGSFYDAQREYFKYASMPRVDMINYLEELNVKYGFAEKDIQSNFDANGKLPRFEDDNDAPCYGCENLKSIDDTNLRSDDNNEVTTVSVNVKIDTKGEIKFLQTQLSELRQEFLDATDLNTKKSLVNSLNDTVKKIQDLTY
jgi:3-methyladenine DNA glycosylase AlkC